VVVAAVVTLRRRRGSGVAAVAWLTVKNRLLRQQPLTRDLDARRNNWPLMVSFKLSAVRWKRPSTIRALGPAPGVLRFRFWCATPRGDITDGFTMVRHQGLSSNTQILAVSVTLNARKTCCLT